MQAGSPHDVTQVPGQPPAATSSDSTKIASQPPGNFQPNPGYAQPQAAGPFASNQAASNYDRTQVVGPASYGPPVHPVTNFTGNQAQPTPVIHSKKNNLPVIIGLVALILVVVVGAIMFLVISGNSAKPGPATAPAATVASASSPAGTSSAASLASPLLLNTLAGHSETVSYVAFSPDGKTLASGSTDKTIKLWQLGS